MHVAIQWLSFTRFRTQDGAPSPYLRELKAMMVLAAPARLGYKSSSSLSSGIGDFNSRYSCTTYILC